MGRIAALAEAAEAGLSYKEFLKRGGFRGKQRR